MARAQYSIETPSGVKWGSARYLHSARASKRRCERVYKRCVIFDRVNGGVINYGRYRKRRRR